MKKSRRSKKPGRWFFMFVLLISFSASAAAAYFHFKEEFTFESSFIAEIEARQAAAELIKKKRSDMRLYASAGSASDAGGGQVYRKDTMLVVAEDIIRKHLKPYKVRLLDLYMDKEGIIYIDFGDELKKNFKGDALEELNIIGGLYKGIKSAVPGFNALKILIEGRETESFGGHIDISRPIGEEIAESI
jgi:hypothetical protein